MLKRMPRVGERVIFPGEKSPGKVSEVKDNGIVWRTFENGREPSNFIGRFGDGSFNLLAENLDE